MYIVLRAEKKIDLRENWLVAQTAGRSLDSDREGLGYCYAHSRKDIFYNKKPENFDFE